MFKVENKGVAFEHCEMTIDHKVGTMRLISDGLDVTLNNPFLSKVGGTDILVVNCNGGWEVFSIIRHPLGCPFGTNGDFKPNLLLDVLINS